LFLFSHVVYGIKWWWWTFNSVCCQDNSYMAAGAVGSYFWQGNFELSNLQYSISFITK